MLTFALAQRLSCYYFLYLSWSKKTDLNRTTKLQATMKHICGNVY